MAEHAGADPRVDAYIAGAAEFAQPVLTHLRQTMHQACPGVQETIKWGMPFFMHGGRNLAFMAAFKAHCGFGLVHGHAVLVTGKEGEAMGQFGRLAKLADLPAQRALLAHIRKAVALADNGVKPSRARSG